MKLLLDENLSRRLIPFLQHDYPGNSQVVLSVREDALLNRGQVCVEVSDACMMTG